MLPLIFLLGTCIGSFLNVVIFRTQEGRSVAQGRSKCRTCEEPIAAWDLIPVLSYVLLKGRCRKCKAVVSWHYPVIEFATGILFVLAFLSTANSPEDFTTYPILVFRNWVFVSYLVLLFVYDWKHQFILDRFTIPAMVFAFLINLWLGVIPSWSLLIGAVVISLFFWLQFFFSKGTWVGGGDVRMGALMGLMLGLTHGVVALFIAYILGAIVGVFLLVSGIVGRKTPIPFGTFMALATAAVLFAGSPILDWYLGFF